MNLHGARVDELAEDVRRAPAAAHLNHGLEIHSERGDPTGQADALTGLAALERQPWA